MVLLPEEVGEKGFLESRSPTFQIDSSRKGHARGPIFKPGCEFSYSIRHSLCSGGTDEHQFSRKNATLRQLRAVDHSARGSMKNAASCEGWFELQNTQIADYSNAHCGSFPSGGASPVRGSYFFESPEKTDAATEHCPSTSPEENDAATEHCPSTSPEETGTATEHSPEKTGNLTEKTNLENDAECCLCAFFESMGHIYSMQLELLDIHRDIGNKMQTRRERRKEAEKSIHLEKENDQFRLRGSVVEVGEDFVPSLTGEGTDNENLVKLSTCEIIEAQLWSEESARLIWGTENGASDEASDQEGASMQLIPVRQKVSTERVIY
ncbi:uncharacterized protein TNCV_230761 [Trichonephila clavipes]|nr:uncharacterized protein TNCV_230761 [Trichonephila clavipes]